MVARRSGRPLDVDRGKFPDLPPPAQEFVIELNGRLNSAGISYKAVCERQGLTVSGPWISGAMRTPAGAGRYVYDAIVKTLAQQQCEESSVVGEVISAETALHEELDPLFLAAYGRGGRSRAVVVPQAQVVEDQQLTAQLLEWLWSGREVDTEFLDLLDARRNELPASLVQIIGRDRFAVAGLMERIAELRGWAQVLAILDEIDDLDGDLAAAVRVLIDIPAPEPEKPAPALAPSILDLAPAAGAARRRAALLARGSHDQVIREFLVLMDEQPKEEEPNTERRFDWSTRGREVLRERSGTEARPSYSPTAAEALTDLAAVPDGPALVAALLNALERAGHLTTALQYAVAVLDAYHDEPWSPLPHTVLPLLTRTMHRSIVTSTCTEQRIHDSWDGESSVADLQALAQLLDRPQLCALVESIVVPDNSSRLAIAHCVEYLLDATTGLLADLMKSSPRSVATLIGKTFSDLDSWSDTALPEKHRSAELLVSDFLAGPENLAWDVWDDLMTRMPAAAALFVHALLQSGDSKVNDFLSKVLASPARLRNLADLIVATDDDIPLRIFETINTDLPVLAGPLNRELVNRNKTPLARTLDIRAAPTFGTAALHLLAAQDTTGPWALALDRLHTDGPEAAQQVLQAYTT